MEANVIYNELPMKVSEQKYADEDQLVALATEIWNKVLTSQKQEDDLLEELQTDYKDFLASFPLVLRWMVNMRYFNVTVFRKFLRFYSESFRGIGSNNDFLLVQVEYLVMIRQHMKKTTDDEDKTYRAGLFNELVREEAEFKAKKQEEERKKQIERVKRLAELQKH